jgi:hypothetical protein
MKSLEDVIAILVTVLLIYTVAYAIHPWLIGPATILIAYLAAAETNKTTRGN